MDALFESMIEMGHRPSSALAATCADGVLLLAVVRLALVVVVLVVALFFGRLAVRLGALPLVDRVRALAGLRRAAVRAVVRAGTDLPPV